MSRSASPLLLSPRWSSQLATCGSLRGLASQVPGRFPGFALLVALFFPSLSWPRNQRSFFVFLPLHLFLSFLRNEVLGQNSLGMEGFWYSLGFPLGGSSFRLFPFARAQRHGIANCRHFGRPCAESGLFDCTFWMGWAPESNSHGLVLKPFLPSFFVLFARRSFCGSPSLRVVLVSPLEAFLSIGLAGLNLA